MTAKTKKPNVMSGLLQWAPGGRWNYNPPEYPITWVCLMLVVAVVILQYIALRILPPLVNRARQVDLSWPNLQLMLSRIPAAWGGAALLAIAVGFFTLAVLRRSRSKDKRGSDPNQVPRRFHDWAVSEGLDIQERSGDQFRVRWRKRSREGSVEEMEELQ